MTESPDTNTQEDTEIVDKNFKRLEDDGSGQRTIIHQTTEYAAPLPLAEQFAQYENVCPGAGLRIIEHMEKEQAHRHEIDKKIVYYKSKGHDKGQNYALVVSLSMLVFAFVAMVMGYPWIAGSVLGVTIIGMCKSFLGIKSGPSKKTDEE